MQIRYTLLTLRICIIIFLALPNQLLASEHSPPDSSNTLETLFRIADEKELASSRSWLSLLHYNRGGTLHSRNQSYVRSDNFFLSRNGDKDPEQELKKNIREMFTGDPAIRCQFPARFHWLSEQLEQKNYLDGLSHCETLLKLKQQIQARKLVLVFPSAYMGSASSIFGHTLFRIDNGEQDESVVLNWAINYGAKLNEQDNGLEYAFKGIFGFYSGQYFVVPYSQKIKEYGQMENRDIWEYPLSLSEQEVGFLIEHLWEVKDVRFDYYFFDENCSYRLLELLEVVRPDLELTNEARLTEIPLDTVKTLEKNGLIEDEIFRPSKERILKSKLIELERNEKLLVKRLADIDFELSDSLTQESFTALGNEQKLMVLGSAFDLLRFQQSRIERDKLMAKRSLDLLKEINQLTYSNKTLAISPEVERPESILDSHDSQRVSLGFGRLNDENNFSDLQYRMAYHDFADNAAGYLNGALIEALDFKLRITEDKNFLESWSLFRIRSLNPRNFVRKDLSWALELSGSRHEEGNLQLSSFLQAGAGFSWEYKDLLHYQLLSPRIETNPAYNHSVKTGLEYSNGLILNRGKHVSSLNLRVLKLEALEEKYIIGLEQQFEISRQQAIRLSANYFEQEDNPVFNEDKSLSLSYFYYF